MNSRHFLLLALIGLLSNFESSSQSRDTLTAMTYNLMYYRETTSFCTNTNNNPSSKDGWMTTIIDEALPDILVVNELGASNAALNSFRLLSNALNQNGRNYYSFANATNSGSLANMIYFNSNKLGLASQTTINRDLNNNQLVRLLDVYTLYHKEPNLAQHQDTTFIHIVAAHLKAGNTTSDQNERTAAARALMSYLVNQNLDGNVMLFGDLNLYTASETAYQELINYSNSSYRFYDPVNISGNWSNSVYAILHTQSTHTSGSCFAGGGMDNRFDFILASDDVMQNTSRVKYLTNSYRAMGQDGFRYNGSLISPTNNSLPTNVINALYNMSDHLPVLLDLEITGPISSNISESIDEEIDFHFMNPTIGELKVEVKGEFQLLEEINLMDMSGKHLKTLEINGGSIINEDLTDLTQGIYFLRFRLSTGNQVVKKLIKI